MKTTRRVRITALVALVVAIAGVVEAHGSAPRLTAGEGTVWAAGGHCASSVMCINGRTNMPAGAVKGTSAPVGVAVDVRDDSGRVLRIDPQR
jgi:hypothetical protein